MLRPDTPSRVLALRACEADDIALIKEAFRQQEIGPSRYYYPNEEISEARERELGCFTDEVLYEAINSNATSVLGHLIKSGVSVKKLSGGKLATDGQGASQATLEFLLARGWDINHRVKYDSNTKGSLHAEAEPFLWRIIRRPAVVKWCLKHGASVHPRDYRPYTEGRLTGDQRKCEPILEVAARCTDVATFELLRSRGAPLGRRTLHIAVEAACWNGSDSNPKNTNPENQSEKQNEEQVDKSNEKQSEENEKQNEKQSAKQPGWQYENDDGCGFGTKEDRLAMVRHLIDNLGMDVNALVQLPGVPNCHEAPIEYIEGSLVRTGDTRDITWLLLDRGANPAPAYRIAKKDYPKFIEDVEAWKEARGGPTFTQDMEAWEKAHNPRYIEDTEAEKKARQWKNGCCVQ